MKKLDYEEVFSFCFGGKAFQMVLVVILLLDFGTMCSYIIIIADSTLPPLNAWGWEDASREVVVGYFVRVDLLICYFCVCGSSLASTRV